MERKKITEKEKKTMGGGKERLQKNEYEKKEKWKYLKKNCKTRKKDDEKKKYRRKEKQKRSHKRRKMIIRNGKLKFFLKEMVNYMDFFNL